MPKDPVVRKPAARPAIVSIGTALPPFHASQDLICEWMSTSFGEDPAIHRTLKTLYKGSGIDYRFSCLDDYLRPPIESQFAPGKPPEKTATTAERMAIYERESILLGVRSAKNAIEDLARTTGSSFDSIKSGITHVVAISCTGFFAPGLDLVISKELNLDPEIGRTLIGFMGCAAMFNGLRTATQIAEADPTARVLVVSVEISSIHIQPGREKRNLVAASLFADGSSACIVEVPAAGQSDCFRIEALITLVAPDTAGEMIWKIGDHGFELKLSQRIPRHLEKAAPEVLRGLFGRSDPEYWAIHPGGPAILDRLASVLSLSPEDLFHSRNTLRRVGNISSSTILFVLNEFRKKSLDSPRTGVAMAFGPGLVIEMARLAYTPARAVHARENEVSSMEEISCTT